MSIILNGNGTSNFSSNIANDGTVAFGSSTLNLDSSGNLGLGTTLPGSFNSSFNNLVVGSGSGNEGITVYTGNVDAGFLAFSDTADTSVKGLIEYNHNGNYMGLRTNGSEAMRIDSSGTIVLPDGSPGIQFGSVSSQTPNGTASSTTLDDYEEGSWSPVTTNFTYTLGADDCTYTKIGRMVYLAGVITRNQSTAPTSDIFTITGLPYAQSSLTKSIQGTYWLDNFNANDDYIGGISYSNAPSQIIFAQATTPTHTHSTRYLQGNYFDNNRGMRFSLVYITG